MQRGPRRLDVSLLLSLRTGALGFVGQNQAQRGLYLKTQLGLSLVSGQDGFRSAAYLQIQAGNPRIRGQGGALVPWNFHFLWQRSGQIQRRNIFYPALWLFSNWWRIPGGRRVSFAFQGRYSNFAGNLTRLHGRIQLVTN